MQVRKPRDPQTSRGSHTWFRRAKKQCDQAMPICGRCSRTGKACGGYRDINELIFKDEGPSLSRRASLTATSPSPALDRPDHMREDAAIVFFFEQFVTEAHLAFMRDVSVDTYLRAPVLACAYAVMGNCTDHQETARLARSSYVDALSATQAAIQDPVRVREDAVLITVLLLSLFEVSASRRKPRNLGADKAAAHRPRSLRWRISRCMEAAY